MGLQDCCDLRFGKFVDGACTPAPARSSRVSGIPCVFGVDEQGREILSMIPGIVGNHPVRPEMTTDASLIACGQMLRRYHEAAQIQPGWANLPWRYRDPDPAAWEVICHGDVATCNIVHAGDVGLIDVDVAGPGPKLWDVAYAAYRLVPRAPPPAIRLWRPISARTTSVRTTAISPGSTPTLPDCVRSCRTGSKPAACAGDHRYDPLVDCPSRHAGTIVARRMTATIANPHW